MDNFLSDDNVISDIPSRNESNLFLRNDFRKDVLEPVSYNLYHQFIEDRVKTNESKLRKAFWILDLGEENNQRVIKISINVTIIEDFFNPITDCKTYSIPLLLEEKSMKTVTSKSFEQGHVKKSIPNFLVGNKVT